MGEQGPRNKIASRPARLVLDTNVLFGAAWGRQAGALLDLWRRGEVVVCLSDALLTEYRMILSRTPRTRAVLAEFLDLAERLPGTIRCATPESLRIVRKDRADDKFVECAAATGADYIITSDRHLRAADGFRGIRVLSAGAYLRLHRPPIAPEEAAADRRRALTVLFGWSRRLRELLRRVPRRGRTPATGGGPTHRSRT